MVSRLEGWEKRYSKFLMERKSMSFTWGSHDCMQFVSHGVEAITGVNFYAPYSNYKTEKGAKGVLKTNGGIIGIIDKCLGKSHGNYMKAKRGDVVIVRIPEIVGGLVSDCGQKIVALSAEKGFVHLPLDRAYRVWSY